MHMDKPDYRIAETAPYEYDLSERVVRRMQQSPLHVFHASVASAVPAAIGDPDDLHSMLLVDLVLLTDGRRGWLVLVQETSEYDAAFEMTELVGQVSRGACRFVVLNAVMWRAPRSPDTLDLREPTEVRARLEATFERAFAGRGRSDVQTLLDSFVPWGHSVRDELALRKLVSQNDPPMADIQASAR